MAFPQKIPAGLTAALAGLCLFLTGCRTQLLAEREIVRAIFFAGGGESWRAVLLLADAENGAGEDDGAPARPGYKIAAGQGETPAAALNGGVKNLEGQVFYGLMDLVVLPSGAGWEEAVEVGNVLYEQAQPSPEISVFLLDETAEAPLDETAPTFYEAIQGVKKADGLQCGLQRLFTDAAEIALPTWDENRYGFAFLQKGKAPVLLRDPLDAQLAAVLCGQAGRLNSRFDGGSAFAAAKASAAYAAAADGTVTVRLSLKDAELSELSGAGRDSSTLATLLTEELGGRFAALYQAAETDGFDPLHLDFWAANRTGMACSGGLPGFVVEIEEK